MSANIKTVVNLTGTQSTQDWDFKRAKITSELDMRNPKNIRGVQLSSEGVVFYKGREVFLGLPWEELWKLAETLEPKFLPAQPQPGMIVPVAKQ